MSADRGPGDGPVLFAGRPRVVFAAGRNGAAHAAVDAIPSATPAAARPSATWITPALLSKIHAPTLVISGDLDVGMPWDGHAAVLAQRDRGRARGPAPGGAHLQPRAPAIVQRGAPRLPGAAASRDPRRGIRGRGAPSSDDDYVDRAIAGTTDFTRDFQELITSYAWGSIWTRPGLDHRTRRLLVLTATAALGRWEEFRLHVRTGLAHELEPCDLRGSAAAGGGLRRRSGRQRRVPHRGRGARREAGLTFQTRCETAP